MAKAPDDKTKKSDTKKMVDGVSRVRKLLDGLEKIGHKAPDYLTKPLKALDKVGSEIEMYSEALKESKAALDKFERDLDSSCKSIDEAQTFVCKNNKPGPWQFRTLKFVLDPKNKDSVPSIMIKKHLQAAKLDGVCKHWEYCAKKYGN